MSEEEHKKDVRGNNKKSCGHKDNRDYTIDWMMAAINLLN